MKNLLLMKVYAHVMRNHT